MTTERAPARRVWLWAPDNVGIEIFVVGPTMQIAHVAAAILRTAEGWPGWERVQIIASGSCSVGLWASLTKLATYDDPIAEALLMFRSHERLRVIQWTTPSVRGGAVGEW